jgi:hypothetical protein
VTLILLGFARHPFCRSGRIQQHLAWSVEIVMGLAIWVFASLASAQATPRPSRIQERKEKLANPVVVAPAQQTPYPVVPIYGAAAPEQTLPQPPEIAWDGNPLHRRHHQLDALLWAYHAFSNSGRLVKPGDCVDIVIGNFHPRGLLVE